MRVIGGIATGVFVAVLIWGAALFGNRYVVHQEAVICHNQGVQWNVPARYLDQGYNTWVCLMRLPDGHWVSSDQYNASLRDYYLAGQKP